MNDLVQKVAYEFYYQGTQIQYDQKNNRRNLNSVPEDATAYKEIYLDCSSYVNSVYHYIFGINITPTPNTANFDTFAKNNIGTNSEVVYYIDVNDYTTEEEKEAILSEIQSNLQVGDLITYRHNSSGDVGGHVMLYIGDNKFLHCTGSSFDYNNDPTSNDCKDNIEETKSIYRSNASVLFTESGSRYLFGNKSGKEVLSFSVLRPLNRSGLKISEQAYLRYQLQGITIEKVASTPHMSTVNRGEDITYTITLTNKNDITVNDLVIKDVINSLCAYKDATIDNGGTVAGNNVTWNIASIASGASINLSYTVKVKNDAPIGSIINSNDATVNGIKTNKIYHTVGGLTNEDLNSLATSAESMIGNNYDSYIDGLKFIKDVYNDALCYDFINVSYSNNVIVRLIDNNKANNTIDTTHELYPLVNPNFYGGLAIKTGMVSDNLRIRSNKTDYYEKGDIIVVYDSYTSLGHSYLYVDESHIYGLDGSNNVAVLYDTTSKVSKFLEQLIAYYEYVVLRPSLNYNPS